MVESILPNIFFLVWAKREGKKKMFYLTTHSTHFIYGYMASDIWLRTILIVRKETRCRHIGYSFRLTARVLLYAPSHREDNTYHGLCYTSRGVWAKRLHCTKMWNVLRGGGGGGGGNGKPYFRVHILSKFRTRPLAGTASGMASDCPRLSFQPVLHDWCTKSRGMSIGLYI